MATDRNSPDHIPEATTVDQVYFCHTLCQLGKKRGLDGLCDITAFLDTHPGEIVSIVFETYVEDADLVAVLEAAGLVEYAYTHPKGTPWPTLRDLITSNKRLVVFVETGGGDPPWLMPAFVGNIQWASAGKVDASSGTVALPAGTRFAVVTLNHPAA